jgi:hypothetical protein
MIAGRLEPGQVFDFAARQEKILNAVEVADAELGVGPCLDLRAFEGRAAFSEYTAGGVEDFSLREAFLPYIVPNFGY